MTTNEQAGGESRDLDLSQFEGMTPGPWRILSGGGHALPSIRGADVIHTNGMARNDLGISSASYSEEVCQMFADLSLPGPSANARAIAAVPSLIAEVKRLREETQCSAQEKGSREYCSCAVCRSFVQLRDENARQAEQIAELERDRERLDMLGQRSIELVGRLFGIDGVHILGAADNDEDCSMEVAIKILHRRAEEARDRIAKLERYGERHRAVVESLVKWDEQGDEAGATRALVQLDNICNEARAAMQTNPER